MCRACSCSMVVHGPLHSQIVSKVVLMAQVVLFASGTFLSCVSALEDQDWQAQQNPVLSKLPGSSMHLRQLKSTTVKELPRLIGYIKRPSNPVAPASHYVGTPSDAYMAAVHSKVLQYLSGQKFRERKHHILQDLEPRGILICAGGSSLVTSLIIQLRVLRHHLNCSLPVEVAWYGGTEMDDATLATLQEHFGPLTGTDLTQLQYPTHHRPGFEMVNKGRQRFVGKAYALLHCRFREVLLLDADNLPLTNPERLFSAQPYLTHGNQFWPDAWANWVKDDVYRLLGLQAAVVKRLLDEGKGFVQRDAEAGQVVLDRHRHADVLEHLFFINSFFDKVYDHVHGDKDTFALAFAMAGKAHEYNQMSVAPGGAFHWARDVLELKGTDRLEDGWQLLGFLQYDASAQPSFFHRTMNKWNMDEEPWPVQAVTGPMPYRWARYFLAHDTEGPTKGVSWQHAVPRHALTLLHRDPPVRLARATRRGWHKEQPLDVYVQPPCPLIWYLQTVRFQALGLPVDVDANDAAACSGTLAAVMAATGAAGALAVTAGSEPAVEAASVSSTAATARQEGLQDTSVEGDGWLVGREGWRLEASMLLQAEYQEMLVRREDGSVVPDATPLAALRVGRGHVQSQAMEAIQQAYKARLWLRRHRREFPLLDIVV